MIFIAFFALIAGSISTGLMINETSLKRTVIAVICGVLAGIASGVAFAVLFTGIWTLPDAAIYGTVLGEVAALVVSRRTYRVRRAPDDLRGG